MRFKPHVRFEKADRERAPIGGTRRWPTLPDQQELGAAGVRAQSEGEDTRSTRGVLPLSPMYAAFFVARNQAGESGVASVAAPRLHIRTVEEVVPMADVVLDSASTQ